MQIIKPSVEIIKYKSEVETYKHIEKCGRICYRSEAKSAPESYEKFIQALIARGHLSVIEHIQLTAIVICDRGVSHEIVRHRLGSYSQESTRYVNYKEGLTVIDPCFLQKGTDLYEAWRVGMQYCEDTYRAMISLGARPEEARSVLPNSLKTQIAISYNLREWRHFLEVRLSKASHPQIREVASMLLIELYNYLPLIFKDLLEKEKTNCPT